MTDRICLFAAIAGLAALVSGSAFAQTPIQRLTSMPSFWQLHEEVTSLNGGQYHSVRDSSRCLLLGARPQPRPASGGTCSELNFNMATNAIHVSFECDAANARHISLHSQVDMRPDNRSAALHSTTRVSNYPINGIPSLVEMRTVGRYIGPCPTGSQPVQPQAAGTYTDAEKMILGHNR